MKLLLTLFAAGSIAAFAETEEQINRHFAVQPGGKLTVSVSFGAIDISTNKTDEVVVSILRKVSLGSKGEEEAFLRERPVTFSQDGSTVTIESRGPARTTRTWFRQQRMEGRYAISVPARFSVQLNTAGGGISVTDLTGDVKTGTSGGGLKFTRINGPLNGHTSGGGIQVVESTGDIKLQTSGGGIHVSGGEGTLAGGTSGGSIAVSDFKGPIAVETSGGGITVENVAGKLRASTSGGSISAKFANRLEDEVKLETSGGGVVVRIPENSAFDLDAATSGGSVSSELPVSTSGKPARSHLKGPVNGGGKAVVLRTSGGSIHVKKQ